VRIGFGECSGVVVDDAMIYLLAGGMVEEDQQAPLTERSRLGSAKDWLRRRTKRG
jgi:hypothetical protein